MAIIGKTKKLKWHWFINPLTFLAIVYAIDIAILHGFINEESSTFIRRRYQVFVVIYFVWYFLISKRVGAHEVKPSVRFYAFCLVIVIIELVWVLFVGPIFVPLAY